jgi:putative ABC transport system permease protein
MALLPRVVARNKTFAAIVIGALALVMGLSTTMIAIVDGLLYPQFPVRDQAQLYRLEWYPPPSVVNNRDKLAELRLTVADMVAKRARFFAGATAERFVAIDVVLEASGHYSRPLLAKFAALNYFELLGMTPGFGRFFATGDVDAADDHIVISDNVWRSLRRNSTDAFAPFVVHTVDKQFTVVAVMPRGAEAAVGVDVLVASAQAGSPQVLRAKPGVDRTAMLAELAALNAAVAASLGSDASESVFQLKPWVRAAKPVQRTYLALIASAVAILLIAGANLANVQLARGMARRGEMAIRMAMGASRRDIVKLITWESAQLALIGAVVGLALAVWGMQLVGVLLPDGVPGLGALRPQLSWRVFGFAGIAATVCTLIVGMVPALSLSRFDLTTTIKSGGGSTGMVRARSRRYAVLVVAQIAACLALTIGAGLIADAGFALHRLDFGYDVSPLVGVRIGYNRLEPVALSQVVADLRAAPSVESAAAVRTVRYAGDTITFENAFGSESAFQIPVGSYVFKWVTPDIFRTLGVRVTQGSDFAADDAVPQVIVDSITAAQLWPGSSPVGKLVKLGGRLSTRGHVRVVGVVPHLRWEVGLYGDAVQDLQVYYVGRTLGLSAATMTWGFAIARTSNGVAGATAARNHFRAQPRYRVTSTWADYTGLSYLIMSHDLLAVVFGALAVLALLLAAAGVYSVVAYSVAVRRREMGVRMALGASRERIFRMVVGEENLTTLVGLGLGLIGAQWGSTIIADVVFSTGPGQQLAIISGATLGMFGVAMLAAAVPGARAASVSPAESLRAD